MIISGAYFNVDLLLKNTDSTIPNAEALGVGSQLNNGIAKYEPEVLIKCFSYSLYKEFMSQFENYVIKESAEQKWKDLLTGKDYQINDKDYSWRGLIFEEAGVKKSLIANYVFHNCIARGNTNIGIQKEKSTQEMQTIKTLYINSWNDFVEMTTISNNGLVSLYQFINDMNEINSNTYQNFNPTAFKKMNQFSI